MKIPSLSAFYSLAALAVTTPVSVVAQQAAPAPSATDGCVTTLFHVNDALAGIHYLGEDGGKKTFQNRYQTHALDPAEVTKSVGDAIKNYRHPAVGPQVCADAVVTLDVMKAAGVDVKIPELNAPPVASSPVAEPRPYSPYAAVVPTPQVVEKVCATTIADLKDALPTIKFSEVVDGKMVIKNGETTVSYDFVDGAKAALAVADAIKSPSTAGHACAEAVVMREALQEGGAAVKKDYENALRAEQNATRQEFAAKNKFLLGEAQAYRDKGYTGEAKEKYDEEVRKVGRSVMDLMDKGYARGKSAQESYKQYNQLHRQLQSARSFRLEP